ncbi:gag-pol polyprotein [Trifolium pratense]|uniref:Gag-pol polyprotein n=1 Tax=Trifolium pratense TaxID=57577 RepID=A0A2K3M102_TRIPR|nr:gag-pol polyprotein [Trifolium pratense]
MFVAAFHNGLRAGHFNESLAQKPAISMQEINKRAECYIKGEESNSEKRMRDAKEKEYANRRIKGADHQPQRQGFRQESSWYERHKKPYQYPQYRGVRNYQPYDSYTPLNETKVHILHKILSTGMATLIPTKGKPMMLGPNSNAWCAYHRAKGHDTKKCFRLRDLVEELIKSGHLRKFINDAAQGRVVVPKVHRQDSKEPPERDEDQTRARIAVNTIAGGFSGGSGSNNVRKKYARSVTHETYLVGNTSFSPAPDISFTAEDISADVMYWEAFKAMQLAEEQLQPYVGTLVGFSGEQVEVMGYTTLLTTFGEKENAKTIKVRYLVVKTPFTSYNIIIGRPGSNALGTVLSTLYLSMKYPLDNGGVGTIKGDQLLARRCYESSLKIWHKIPSGNGGFRSGYPGNQGGINMVDSADMDPREEFQDRRVSPIEELEQIQIGLEPHQTTNLGNVGR